MTQHCSISCVCSRGAGAGILAPQTTGLIQRYCRSGAGKGLCPLRPRRVDVRGGRPAYVRWARGILGEDPRLAMVLHHQFPYRRRRSAPGHFVAALRQRAPPCGYNRAAARSEYIEMQQCEGRFYKRPKIDPRSPGYGPLALSVLGIDMGCPSCPRVGLLPGCYCRPAVCFWALGRLGGLLQEARPRAHMVDLGLFLYPHLWSSAISVFLFLGMINLCRPRHVPSARSGRQRARCRPSDSS